MLDAAVACAAFFNILFSSCDVLLKKYVDIQFEILKLLALLLLTETVSNQVESMLSNLTNRSR